jgi:hypothetical protein
MRGTSVVACNGTLVALKAGMLVIAREIRGADDEIAQEVHQKVDYEMLGSGVGAQAGWPWALFAVGMTAAVTFFFIYTPH